MRYTATFRFVLDLVFSSIDKDGWPWIMIEIDILKRFYYAKVVEKIFVKRIDGVAMMNEKSFKRKCWKNTLIEMLDEVCWKVTFFLF